LLIILHPMRFGQKFTSICCRDSVLIRSHASTSGIDIGKRLRRLRLSSAADSGRAVRNGPIRDSIGTLNSAPAADTEYLRAGKLPDHADWIQIGGDFRIEGPGRRLLPDMIIQRPCAIALVPCWTRRIFTRRRIFRKRNWGRPVIPYLVSFPTRYRGGPCRVP